MQSDKIKLIKKINKYYSVLYSTYEELQCRSLEAMNRYGQCLTVNNFTKEKYGMELKEYEEKKNSK